MTSALMPIINPIIFNHNPSIQTPMAEYSPANVSLLIKVTGIDAHSLPDNTQDSTHCLVAKAGSSTTYGKIYRGNLNKFTDNFVVDLQEVDTNHVNFQYHVNDKEVGEGILDLTQLVYDSKSSIQNEQVVLNNSSKQKVAILNLQCHKSSSERVVGGIVGPVVSLRNGNQLESFAVPVRSAAIEKVKPEKLNLFSCMDDTAKGWQFAPSPYVNRTNFLTMPKLN